LKNVEFKIVDYGIKIDLSVSQFNKLIEISFIDTVLPAMEKIGVYNIEYDGHFGYSIFFRTENLECVKHVKKFIEKM